jgi:hypothetical protein
MPGRGLVASMISINEGGKVIKFFISCALIILSVGFAQKDERVVLSKVNDDPGSRIAPRLLNYQGYLTDTLGNPVTDPAVSMVFGIWSASTSGTRLWYEDQTVSVTKGIFNVLLGNLTTLPDSVFANGTNRWLELAVDAQTLSPRTRIVSAAYAISATYSDTAQYARFMGADNDWARGTPDSVLFTSNYLGIARGGAGNVLYGTGVFTHTNFGVQCTTGASAANYSYAAIVGGYRNAAVHNYTFIGGGYINRAAGNWAAIAGGYQNLATGNGAACAGGRENDALNSYASIGGGYQNTVNNAYATIAGGGYNVASADYASIPGGYGNEVTGVRGAVIGGGYNQVVGTYGISGGYSGVVNSAFGGTASGRLNTAGAASEDTAAFVGGGRGNYAAAKYSAIAGGNSDTVYGIYGSALSGCLNRAGDAADDTAAFVGGGRGNYALTKYSVIAGGCGDTVKAFFGAVLSGYQNVAGDSASDTAAVVSGGRNNRATAKFATVGGGTGNVADGRWSTVGGGWNNEATGLYNTVAGGYNNVNPGLMSTIGGGHGNTVTGAGSVIAGGSGNTADSNTAAICGGTTNTASGNYSFIGGGDENQVTGDMAVVGGGHWNTAGGRYSVIVGGFQSRAPGDYSFIGSGNYNYASGDYAVVPGGEEDTSAGSYSFTTNLNSVVGSDWDYSNAFSGQTATGHAIVRCFNFSAGGAKAFTIDHPLDPDHKILNHYCIESPEMMVAYRGRAVIGRDGQVRVALPDYFDALSADPLVHLTGIGTYEVFVKEKVSGNSFVIGGKPGAEVNWIVTAERDDPSSRIAKVMMPVEQLKTGCLQGVSLDDDILAIALEYLKSVGKADGFEFRTQRGRDKYRRIQDRKDR